MSSSAFDPTVPINDITPDPTTRVGSMAYDRVNGYSLEWDSEASFLAWKAEESEKSVIEWIVKEHPRPDRDSPWISKTVYVCGRQHAGGRRYIRKTKRNDHKITSKKCGCPSRLTIKSYPNTSIILSKYTGGDHNHAVGKDNAIYTRLPKHLREEIKRLLKSGMKPAIVLKEIQGGQHIYTEDNLENLRSEESTRRHFAKAEDIRAVQRELEAEVVRLASGDGASILQWVENLRAKGHFVYLKTASDPAPEGTSIDPNAFILIVQMRYQKECWAKFGHDRFAGLDATHNTTQYQGVSLFSLLARDDWGHGMPCAWMISSNAQESTVDFFLATMVAENPLVIPRYFMSDKDRGQMNAILRRYPRSRLLLCWWHVLHAWQKHFTVSHYPELWEALKKWIRITSAEEFEAQWRVIQSLAPRSLIVYLEDYWLVEKELWSAVFRIDRTIFTLCDTNMLVEAWHHLLKGKFLEGKRNRRMDQLLYALVDEAIPYFIQRHHRQWNGFDGLDLESKRRAEIEERANSIPVSFVSQLDDDANTCCVQSQSDPSLSYRVDLNASECNCLSFPVIRYCKHLCIARRVHPEDGLQIPIAALAANSDSTEDDTTTSNITDDDDDSNADADQPSISAKDDLIARLSSLASIIRACPTLPEPPATLLSELDKYAALVKHSEGNILPPKVKITPNQHSWTETATVMGVPVKGKRKHTHVDPYSGGTASGTSAKPDASVPLKKAKTSQDLPTTARVGPKTGDCEYHAAFEASTFDFYSNPRVLSSLTVVQLQQLLKRHGLKTRGCKQELIDRLEQIVPQQTPASIPQTSGLIPSTSSVAAPSALQAPEPGPRIYQPTPVPPTHWPPPSYPYPYSYQYPSNPIAYPYPYPYPPYQYPSSHSQQ